MLRRDRPGFHGKGGVVQMADGGMIRGAKRGGVTDHIAGPHMIPNVGREAMVPAEVVKRQPKKTPNSVLVQQQKEQEAKRQEELRQLLRERANKKKKAGPKDREIPETEKAKRKERQRSRSRSRSRDRSGSRSRDRSAGKSDDEKRHSDRSRSPAKEKEKERTRSEDVAEERRLEAQRAATAQLQAKLREELEAKRFEEEAKKLKELTEAKQQKKEMDTARRSKLNGLFALTEDDMEEAGEQEVQKVRAARERQKFEEKRSQRDRMSSHSAGGSSSSLRPSSAAIAAQGAPRLVNNEGLTALDIDGAGHDHKFASVWKDWDAKKKDDPGEIARQFMKVSAIKRRGYDKSQGDHRR